MSFRLVDSFRCAAQGTIIRLDVGKVHVRYKRRPNSPPLHHEEATAKIEISFKDPLVIP